MLDVAWMQIVAKQKKAAAVFERLGEDGKLLTELGFP